MLVLFRMLCIAFLCARHVSPYGWNKTEFPADMRSNAIGAGERDEYKLARLSMRSVTAWLEFRNTRVFPPS